MSFRGEHDVIELTSGHHALMSSQRSSHSAPIPVMAWYSMSNSEKMKRTKLLPAASTPPRAAAPSPDAQTPSVLSPLPKLIVSSPDADAETQLPGISFFPAHA